MLLEDDAFPIIRLHYNHAGEDHASFAPFERLLDQPQPFVIIGMGAPDEPHEQSHEERKQLSLWMKRHREPLHRLVKAMVYVEPQAARRFMAQAFATPFGKFWGFPMLVAPTDEEAVVIAHRLLAGELASSFAPSQFDA